MMRLGLKELRNVMNPSRESVADSEIGLYGTATQGEIADARGGPGQGPEQESMSLGDLRAYAKERAEAAEQAMQQGKEQGRDQRDDRERGGPEL
jgi:flagellar biosynthesis/type III secretory pathway protein FliH